MTNSGTQQRTKLPEKAPVRNAARSLSNWPTKGSQHAQQVYPADAFAGRGVRVGKSGLHLFVGVNRIFAKIRKKARRHDFFRSGAPFFVPGRAVFYALPSCSGRNTPSRPPLRPCSGIRFLPPGSFVRALACRRLRFSHYVPALAFRPFRPGSYPALASEPLSPGCPCAGTHGSPRPVPPAGQFTTTVGKYSRKSAAARSDCSGVFSCTPASLYSLPIASYL